MKKNNNTRSLSYTKIDTSLQKLITRFTQKRKIHCILSKAEMAEYTTDFGRLHYTTPLAVFLPETIAEVQEILSFISVNKLKLVCRGAGHSQSGQSVAASNGVSVDLRSINTSIEITELPGGEATVYCDGGVTLRQLAAYTIPKGYTLPVLPFYLDLTIGGVLSAGGIGSASHRFGALVSNITSLEVITAAGHLIICSRQQSPDIFKGMPGTFGLMGIIARAGLHLIKTKEVYRTYRFAYENIDNWLIDYHLLSDTNISNLQGICTRPANGLLRWNFLLEVTFAGSTSELMLNDGLPKLKYDSLLQTTDHDAEGFISRYRSRFEQMRASGKFDQHHPFLEFIVAEENVRQLIEYAIAILPPAYEDGFRLIYINKKDLPPFFMVPDADKICMFAILPTGINETVIDACLLAAAELHRFAITLGAKRYLSGWLGMMNDAEMNHHFSDKMNGLMRLKRDYDPGNVFSSLFSEKYLDLTIKITIQIATAADIEELARVEIESKIKSIPGCVDDIEIDYNSRVYRWQTYFKGESPESSKSGRLVLKATAGDTIIGFIAGHLTTRYGKDAEIQSFYILKEHQRNGIGTKLFTRLMEWMIEQEAGSVCVGFALENKYQAFYLKKGGQYLNPHWICWDKLEEMEW